MDQSLKKYALEHVARYTSYPTAREFSSRVGQNELNKWLVQIDQTERISLYIHIPFCQKLCWYCACATSAPNKYERISEYATMLRREIRSWARLLNGKGIVARIHFGGGSPNALSEEDFESLVSFIDENFTISNDLQIDIELDPRSLTESFVLSMSKVGVTRASLGVQSLSPAVQDRINRVQPRKQITRAVSHLRKHGVQNISFDLMYGLPAQTVHAAREAASYAAEIGVNRIAIFGYAHIPWFVSRQRVIDKRALPGVDERYAQALAMDKLLTDEGYAPIGFDHYALPNDPLVQAKNTGTLRRTFQGFSDDTCQTIIGIGESAISSFPRGYSQNHKNRRDWIAANQAYRLPIARGVELSAEDMLRGDIIELLLCYGEVDLATICKIYDVPLSHFDKSVQALEELERDRLCSLHGSLITIPEQHKFFSRQVAAKFDSYAIEDGHHAIAV